MDKQESLVTIPQHVGIIMDGNGRWALEKGLTREEGHRAGTAIVRGILEECANLGVEVVTLYAFSTENWLRPRDEIEGLMRVLREGINKYLDDLSKENVQFRYLGNLDKLDRMTRAAVNKALSVTRNNTGMTVCVAFDYGGRAEILRAARKIVADDVPADALTEELFGQYLYTAGLPDPDLIIRTGGEMRLSNFLIWQAAYAEYYSTPTFWPDFDKEELYRALLAYSQRERRFGLLREE